MKGVKGRILKKLKSIRPINSFKQGHFLQLNSSDVLLDPLQLDSNRVFQNSSACRKEQDQKIEPSNLFLSEPDSIDISELMNDLTDEDFNIHGDNSCNKENIFPSIKQDPTLSIKDNSERPNLRNDPSLELDTSSFERIDPSPINDNFEALHRSESIAHNLRTDPLSDIDISSFRRPEFYSGSLFDPNLLMAFEKAMIEHMRAQELARTARFEIEKLKKDEESLSKALKIEENPLLEYEDKCPPGGSSSVILYTTSIRGIRKTFEDCSNIRFLLGSFRILYFERDVSMHSDYREELWKILGNRVVPPRLFIKGRYIGGADEVIELHEQGKLRWLVEGVPMDRSDGPCAGCAGIRFVLCFSCSGSRRVSSGDGESEELYIRCLNCNENGLIICPLCC